MFCQSCKISLLSRQKHVEQCEWWGPKPNLWREWREPDAVTSGWSVRRGGVRVAVGEVGGGQS